MTITQYITDRSSGKFVPPISYFHLAENSIKHGKIHSDIMDYLFSFLKKYDIETVAEAAEMALVDEHIQRHFLIEESTLEGGLFREGVKIADSVITIQLSEPLTKAELKRRSKSLAAEYRAALNLHKPEFISNHLSYFSHVTWEYRRNSEMLRLPDMIEYLERYSESELVRYEILKRKAISEGKKFVTSDWCWCPSFRIECRSEISLSDVESLKENTSEDLKWKEILSAVARFRIYSLFAEVQFDDDIIEDEFFVENLKAFEKQYRELVEAELELLNPTQNSI